MNICNENGIYIPSSSCDCDEIMQALVAYKKEVQALLADIEEAIAKKQNILTAGANITIRNDVISATGGGGGGTTEYEAGDNILISGNTINVVDVVTDDEFTQATVLQTLQGTRTTMTIVDTSNVSHNYDIIILE